MNPELQEEHHVAPSSGQSPPISATPLLQMHTFGSSVAVDVVVDVVTGFDYLFGVFFVGFVEEVFLWSGFDVGRGFWYTNQKKKS